MTDVAKDSSTPFSELIGAAHREAGGLLFSVPGDWMQGRTTYGGLSTALALEAAVAQHDDLPPLRSANVSFLGPAGGDVRATSRVLRRGRSVSFIEADVECEGKLATRCVFAFGASRQSAHERRFVNVPEVPAAEDCESYISGPLAPRFTGHFESRLARGGRPMSSSKHSEHLIWVRHRDPNAKGLPALLAVADMPPPAIMPMFSAPAPISSMTWLVNVVDSSPSTDGWWLLLTRAEHAADGYSSQDMFVWNSDGNLAATGRQSIAIFA